MAAKKLTPQQQRDRRAKIMLAVLGGVLLLIVAVEAPGLLAKKKPAAPPAPAVATGSPTASTPGASLASAQVVATPQAGQLHSFTRFAAKDPFHPLISTAPGAAGATTPSPGRAAKPGGGAAASTTTAAAPTVTFAQTPTTTAAAQTGPMVLGAVMKLNGVRRLVAVGSLFPTANPVFKLVAVGRKAIWISLIGGSFGNGRQTLKVERGQPIKLVNQTASVSYLLRLVRMTMLPKPATPPAATVPTAATTSTATTTAATTTTGN